MPQFISKFESLFLMNSMMLTIIKQCQPQAAVIKRVAKAMNDVCYFNILTKCLTMYNDPKNSMQRY